ncbi:MAG: hypothetical protein KGP14_10385, partial [Betaproteobacteria bacterium]|nr:hypothetical protein [Betaproteobacteria bacterium]
LTLEKVQAAIAFDQPKLHARLTGEQILIEGGFLVVEKDVAAAPDGPITEFSIRLEVSRRYPNLEPKVFEVDGRIPRNPDHHINDDGDCCVTVWEHWLATAADRSIGSFINGPLNEYFLSQFWFEKTGKWPFGERPHGTAGMEEAYADALGIANRREALIYHLRLLSQEWPKGHWVCPCGSGQIVRQCHRDDLMSLHRRVAPHIAKRMLRRLLRT